MSCGLWASSLGTTRGVHTQFCIKFQEIHPESIRVSWESVPPKSRAPSLFYFYCEMRKVTKFSRYSFGSQREGSQSTTEISIWESRVSSKQLRSTDKLLHSLGERRAENAAQVMTETGFGGFRGDAPYYVVASFVPRKIRTET